MVTHWLKRGGLTIAIAIPVWVGFDLLSYVIFCGLAGPWGAALEDVGRADLPAYTIYLEWLRRIVMIAGALLIGWLRAGRMVKQPEAGADARR
ncbi:MAG: hypothetical protein ACYC26_10750 [Phycisphaerales bacterium]